MNIVKEKKSRISKMLILFVFLVLVIFLRSFPYNYNSPNQNSVIELTFLVLWPYDNNAEYYSSSGGYTPLQDPPSTIKIVQSTSQDGYETSDTPEWEILGELPLTFLGGSNRSYSASGSVSEKNLSYLAVIAGIPTNYYDGKVAVSLSSYKNGDIVELYYMRAIFLIG